VPQETAIVHDISLGGQKAFMAIRLKKGSCLSFNIQLFLGSRPNQCVKSSRRQSCKRTLNPKFLGSRMALYIYTLQNSYSAFLHSLSYFLPPTFSPRCNPCNTVNWIFIIQDWKCGEHNLDVWSNQWLHIAAAWRLSWGKKWEYICKTGNEFEFHTKLESKTQPKLNPKLGLRL
jgi:hypothetical protein